MKLKYNKMQWFFLRLWLKILWLIGDEADKSFITGDDVGAVQGIIGGVDEN